MTSNIPLPISFSGGFHLRREAQFLTEFGHKVAQVVREIRASDTFWVTEKGDGGCVTTADPVVQILFALEVESTFPGDAIIAEEDADSLAAFPDDQLFDIMHWVRQFSPPNYTAEIYEAKLRAWADRGRGPVGRRHWGLDPTDATTELVKDREYSINGHLIEDGEVQLGFIACPNLRLPCSPESNRGELLVAVMGHGAYACGLTEDDSFHRLRVSKRRSLKKVIPIRPWKDTPPHCEPDDLLFIRGFHTILGTPPKIVRASSPHRFALLAAGEGDYLCNLGLTSHHPMIFAHDIAGPLLVVEEAGGFGRDLMKKPYDHETGLVLENNIGMIAANSEVLFDAVLGCYHGSWNLLENFKRVLRGMKPRE